MFLRLALTESKCITAGPLSSCNSFFVLFIHTTFLLFSFSYFLSVLISYSKCLLSPLHLVVDYPCEFSVHLLLEFLFVISEVPVMFSLRDSVPVSFLQYLWFSSCNCIVRFICCFLVLAFYFFCVLVNFFPLYFVTVSKLVLLASLFHPGLAISLLRWIPMLS